jgi:hypothetical protein
MLPRQLIDDIAGVIGAVAVHENNLVNRTVWPGALGLVDQNQIGGWQVVEIFGISNIAMDKAHGPLAQSRQRQLAGGAAQVVEGDPRGCRPAPLTTRQDWSRRIQPHP